MIKEYISSNKAIHHNTGDENKKKIRYIKNKAKRTFVPPSNSKLINKEQAKTHQRASPTPSESSSRPYRLEKRPKSGVVGALAGSGGGGRLLLRIPACFKCDASTANFSFSFRTACKVPFASTSSDETVEEIRVARV